VRGGIYYDGFNMYHAVDDIGKPYLKWCNLWKLGELVAKGHAKSIERAVFCTAYFPGDHGKRVRHEAYVNALKLVGVEPKFGHTTTEPMACNDCGRQWQQPREKETDINVALALFEDAIDDRYDVAFLVTADTDQASTIKAFRRRFPLKKIINVVPPGRVPSKHLADLCHNKVKLREQHFDECALPEAVMAQGQKTIYRPREYDPPVGWVHPDLRP
jgi:NYN domain